MNLCRPWPQGSRSCGVAKVEDRVRCGGAYVRLQPTPPVFREHRTLHVQTRSREALPRKRRTTAWWPWRGRRGLRLCRRVSSHGGCYRMFGEVYGIHYVRDTAVAGIQDPGPVRRETTNNRKEGKV